MDSFYVYQLIDPRNNTPFYIGKGHGKRMYFHERLVRHGKIPNGNLHLYYKIRKLHQLGITILYKKVVDNVNEEISLLVEKEEIQRLGRTNLCNLTDGGDGISGLKFSEESKRKMSATAKKRLENPHNHPMYGKKHTEYSKSRMSDSNKIRFSNPEERLRTSKSTRIGMYSSGHIDKISKEITLLSPSGELVTSKNISKFCRDNNLQNGNLYKVINKKIHSHRGWRLPSSVTQKEKTAL
jgi:hypothetical protein